MTDLIKMQALMVEGDSHLPERWQVWDLLPAPWHWGGGIMTLIEGRRPPKQRGEEAGLNVFRGNNAVSLSAATPEEGAGGRI